MGPTASPLSGNRLHLQHGPIDLIISVDGDQIRAFAAAQKRFETILEELMAEITLLRSQVTPDLEAPQGTVAKRMDHATQPFGSEIFVTRMAAVAGSVADEVLDAMKTNAEMRRAYVNNGGDIALHLTPGQSYRTAMASHAGQDLGRIVIHHNDNIRGIASSSRHGRSLSLGIADNVTVLACNAAKADVAATLIANAVDLPDHPAVNRRSASAITDDSDLGDQLAVVDVETLSKPDVQQALQTGLIYATTFMNRNRIAAASLYLQGEIRSTAASHSFKTQRIPEHA